MAYLQEIRGFKLHDKAIPDEEPTAISKTTATAAIAAKPTDLFCKSILATRGWIGDAPDLECQKKAFTCFGQSTCHV